MIEWCFTLQFKKYEKERKKLQNGKIFFLDGTNQITIILRFLFFVDETKPSEDTFDGSAKFVGAGHGMRGVHVR